MILEFFDKQEHTNLANGTRIEKESDLDKLLAELLTRKPFFCELVNENRYKELIGIAGEIGCVQYSRTDGAPPYLMALNNREPIDPGYIEFLVDNKTTPVSMRYCISFENVRQIANYFLRTGERDPSFSWEEI